MLTTENSVAVDLINAQLKELGQLLDLEKTSVRNAELRVATGLERIDELERQIKELKVGRNAIIKHYQAET